MGKVNNYELMVSLNLSYSGSDIDTELKLIEDYLEANVTELTKTKIGRKALAYEINRKKFGFYMVYNFKATGEFAKYELERKLNFNESILRYVVINEDNRKVREVNVGGKQVKIDYKDTELLNQFTSEYNKILPRKVTKLKEKYQKKVAKEVKLARIMALMPFEATCIEN